MPPHLLVDISSHGFGHLAQVGPVLRTLRSRVPELHMTVRSTLPESVLRRRIGGPLQILSVSKDVGMRMASAMDVLPEESAQDYRALHQDWPGTVAGEADALRRIAPDLILADVPYLTLAAAAAAGVPAIAMCSLHWGDIYARYCGQSPEAVHITEEILDAYRQARVFIQLAPHMPMTELPRRRGVGPVAQRGTNRRRELDRRLGLSPAERLALIGLGGIDTRLPIDGWPRLRNIRWVVPGDWVPLRSDCLSLDELDMPFIDVLASCDLLITKPGYGAFTEAACNGVPVLYVRRGDWPEEPYLTGWLERHGRAARVDRGDLESGRIGEPIEELLSVPPPPPPAATGAAEAADILAAYLDARP